MSRVADHWPLSWPRSAASPVRAHATNRTELLALRGRLFFLWGGSAGGRGHERGIGDFDERDVGARGLGGGAADADVFAQERGNVDVGLRVDVRDDTPGGRVHERVFALDDGGGLQRAL